MQGKWAMQFDYFYEINIPAGGSLHITADNLKKIMTKEEISSLSIRDALSSFSNKVKEQGRSEFVSF